MRFTKPAKWIMLLSALYYSGNSMTAYAQFNTEIFGKQRIQYRKMEWKYFEGSNFNIYHYDRSGRELARFVVEQVERDIAAIESRLGGLFPEKINIILYNNFDDYNQSNIGLIRPTQFKNNNVAGNLDVIGDKIPVYFDGNHNHLKEQLRTGMAQIVMERMMYGETFREIVRNMVLLDLPKWTTEGYVDYIVKGWTAEDDNDWKNLVLKEDINDKSFLAISEAQPRLVGKAIYKYIEHQYGENSIRNLLYMTQVKSGLNNAMKLTIGSDLKTFYGTFINFYKKHYEEELTKYDAINYEEKLAGIPAPKPGERYSQIYVSPKGQDIAYVVHKNGEYSVVLEKTNMKDGERAPGKILNSGVLNYEDNGDPDYPIIAWSNTGFKLGIVYKEGKQLYIRVYDANKSRVMNVRIPKNKIDRITGFTFMEDDDFIVLSGIKNGQSDIFELYVKRSRITAVTNDAWDDTDPIFVSGGSRKGIVFLSNRPEPILNLKALPNELPTGDMKAYFYNSTTKSYHLLYLTPGFQGNIKNIIPYGMDNFAFLSDKSGINNRYVVMFGRDQNNMDSAYVIPTTNFNNGILFQQYHPSGQKIVDVVQEKDKINFFYRPAELPAPWGNLQPKEVKKNEFVENRLELNQFKLNDQTGDGNIKINPNDLFQSNEDMNISTGNDFQTAFNAQDIPNVKKEEILQEDAEKFAEALNIKGNTPKETATKPTFYDPVRRAYISDTSVLFVDSTFMTLRAQTARSAVSFDYLGISLDNSVLFNKYQSYMQHVGQYVNTNIGFLLMGSLYDRNEDYRFVGGVRLPSSLMGLSYYGRFENLRGRNDWGFTYFSSSNMLNYTFMVGPNLPVTTEGRVSSTFLQFDFSRPLDKVSTIKANLAYRQNNMEVRAIDANSLFFPNTKEHWGILHAEYMYDNTSNPMLNIWNGLRGKFYADVMYKFNDNNEAYEIGGYQRKLNSMVYNIGFDVRYYMPVFRTSILAVRGSGAHSGGSQQIIYYMGGMENEINPQQAVGLPPSANRNYAFQSLANNLRGYRQNARNGNTYALLNVEYRVPVMTTIFNRPTNSSILKNLQLVAFLDAGSAWEGLFGTEDGADKRFNVYHWPNMPNRPVVSLQFPGSTDYGLAMSYGIGARTKLLSYFLKIDGAMNIDGKLEYHISIGTDF